MKLWLQSCGDLGVNPMWNEYEASLKRHFRKVARPDTEVSLHGTNVFSGRTRLYQYDVYLHTSELIEKAISAEQQGYDAYVQVGMQDYGYFEVKEVVGIPVIFPVENALRVASMFAPKIAFLTYSSVMLERLNDKARKIAQQGANIMITAGNPITMLLIDNGRTELAGVRVLDSQGTLVKMAEFMVDLHKMGINRNSMGEYAPQPRDILAMTRKLYGVG